MYKLNCIRGEKDKRDVVTSRVTKLKSVQLPPAFTLTENIPVYSQGTIGSCTANAASLCYRWESFEKTKNFKFEPSRLFIYYNTRTLEGTVNDDDGATIRNTFKALNRFGVASESSHPYIEDKFTLEPSLDSYQDALLNTVVKYSAVPQKLNAIKQVLVSGAAVAFGFMVYDSFMEEGWHKDGIMPKPSKGERELGGHAVAITAYDDAKKAFLIQNSWGSDWGVGGRFWMPYDLILDSEFAFDFWCIDEIAIKNVNETNKVMDAVKLLFTPATLAELPKQHIRDIAEMLGFKLSNTMFRSKLASELVAFVFGYVEVEDD